MLGTLLLMKCLLREGRTYIVTWSVLVNDLALILSYPLIQSSFAFCCYSSSSLTNTTLGTGNVHSFNKIDVHLTQTFIISWSECPRIPCDWLHSYRLYVTQSWEPFPHLFRRIRVLPTSDLLREVFFQFSDLGVSWSLDSGLTCIPFNIRFLPC